MNRIEFSLFIKKTFGAKYNQGRQEWRFDNGDRVYTLDARYETNRSTFEPHVETVKLFARELRTQENAADDIGRSSKNVKYTLAGEITKDRITREELRAWIVKALVTYEFDT